jgi:hypothetical protein
VFHQVFIIVCSSLLQEANNTDIARSGQVIYRQGNERGEKKKKKKKGIKTFHGIQGVLAQVLWIIK